MNRSITQAIDEITKFVRDMGESYDDWYVGISEDPMTRLYSYHRVSRHSDLVIAVPTEGEDDARAVEKGLIALGFQSGGGDGPEKSTWVYAYKITWSTIP